MPNVFGEETPNEKKIRRLKELVQRNRRLVRRYRRLTDRLIEEGLSYTTFTDCCFCSGDEGYRPARESQSGEVKHSRKCPTRKAAELEAVEI